MGQHGAKMPGPDVQRLGQALRPEAGTYALILRSDANGRVQVGRNRSLQMEAGYYVYVGSAFGPGGVRARVLRHARNAKSKHWHIDFLRAVAAPIGVWCAYADRDLEHRWARTLSGLPDLTPVPAFGCTDCNCETHLFRSRVMPSMKHFARATGETDDMVTLTAVRV